MSKITYNAVKSLRPTANFNIVDGELNWFATNDTPQPTQAEIDAEMLRLQVEYDATEYQRLRAAEYPPMAGYLDAVVKGDVVAQQAYIDECLAVKAKYPKGGVI